MGCLPTNRVFSDKIADMMAEIFDTATKVGQLVVLAQQAAKQPSPLGNTLLVFAPILLLFYFLIMRPQQREQQQRRSMIEKLKKNDRVIFAGGIYGVVTNVHREADEVTVKIDEANNTKLRVTVGSILKVCGEEPTAEK